MTGVFDAGCRPIGYGLVIGLTGASRAEVLRDRPMVYVSIPSGGPLAADIPAGARLDVSPASQVALRHPRPDAFYSDYTLGANPVQGQPFLDAALVRSMFQGAHPPRSLLRPTAASRYPPESPTGATSRLLYRA